MADFRKTSEIVFSLSLSLERERADNVVLKEMTPCENVFAAIFSDHAVVPCT